jgi:hypothetical protein
MIRLATESHPGGPFGAHAAAGQAPDRPRMPGPPPGVVGARRIRPARGWPFLSHPVDGSLSPPALAPDLTRPAAPGPGAPGCP